MVNQKLLKPFLLEMTEYLYINFTDHSNMIKVTQSAKNIKRGSALPNCHGILIRETQPPESPLHYITDSYDHCSTN